MQPYLELTRILAPFLPFCLYVVLEEFGHVNKVTPLDLHHQLSWDWCKSFPWDPVALVGFSVPPTPGVTTDVSPPDTSRCPLATRSLAGAPLSPGELLAAPHSPRPPGSGIPPNVTPTYQEGAEHPVTLPQPLWGPTPSLYSTLVLLDPFRVPLIASPFFSILNVGPLALDRPLAGHPI